MPKDWQLFLIIAVLSGVRTSRDDDELVAHILAEEAADAIEAGEPGAGEAVLAETIDDHHVRRADARGCEER